MKKSLFFLAVAAVALASCSSDDTIAENSNVGKNQQKEIAFMPINLPSTRTTIVNGTTFPTDYNFYIAAYSATPAGDFFGKTEYTNEATTIWSGVTGQKRYWPLGDATLNFLAITKAGSRTTTFNATHPANSVVVDFTDNSTIASQHDLMWSYAQATVAQVGNGISFNNGGSAGVSPVSMTFQHAESQVNFKVKAGNLDTENAGLTLTSITLNDGNYAGTYTLTFADYASTSAPAAPTGVWSGVTDPTTSNPDVVAPQTTANMPITQTSGSAVIGDGILVVPNPNVDGGSALNESFKSFTIAYKMNGNDYTYTYTPDIAQRRLVPDTKYVFDITMTLQEIKVNASVEDWTPNSESAVTMP